jgi:carbamoyl-phosphate synthase large subunit
MSVTILVTATGGGLSAQSIALMKASRRHDVRVVAVNAGESATARAVADEFHVVPRGSEAGYVEAIADIARRCSVDLVLPWSDEEALALAAARERIEHHGTRLACANADMLRMMSDKARCYAFLSERGVPVPESYDCASVEELEAALGRFYEIGEFAIKPKQSRGNRGIVVVRSDVSGVRLSHSGREQHMDFSTFREECRRTLDARLPLVVSQRMREPAYDIDVLADGGLALRVVPRRRHNPEGMPFLGNTIVNDPALVALGQQVASAVGLSWLYDFDVMVDDSGNPTVIECNPRPSGSCAASVVAGVPLFDDLISYAKGEILAPQSHLPAEVRVLPTTSLMVAR